MKKIVSLLLVLLLAAGLLSACGGGSADGGSTDGGDTASVTESIEEGTGDTLNFKGYKIIRPRYASSYAVQLELNKLSETIKEKYDVNVKTFVDFYADETDKEIIISGADRTGLTEIINSDEYSVKVENGKVYLEGGSSRALKAAAYEFRKLIDAGTEIKNGLKKSGTYSATAASADETFSKLTWGDEFDGTEIDKSKWAFQNMSTPASDIKQVMEERTCGMANGELYLNAFNAKAEDLEKSPNAKYYAPKFVTTSGTMEFQYGCFEAKTILPFYKGCSPALWFCSTAVTERGNHCEIDLVELLGHESNTVCNLHNWGSSGHTSLDNKVGRQSRSHTFESSTDTLRNEYHTFFLNWTAESIDFGVDCEVYYHADITANGTEQFSSPDTVDMDVFHLPIYIIISDYLYSPARKLSWGLTGNEGDFNYTMKLDYVNIYQYEGVGKLITY